MGDLISFVFGGANKSFRMHGKISASVFGKPTAVRKFEE